MLTKLMSKLHLFINTYDAMPFYINTLSIFIALITLILIYAYLIYLRKGKFIINLLSIPSFIVILPIIFSLFVFIFGKINITICGTSLIFSFILNYFYVQQSSLDATNTSLICKSYDIKKFPIWLIHIGILVISILFVLSIDHNWVPPQYDITTYQFLGDLIFRNNTYPTIQFADSHTYTIFVPPGYFIFDFIMRIFWNTPRLAMPIATLFFVCVIVLFIRLTSLFFKDKKVEKFALLALFTRGLFWNFWEFNGPRVLSLACSLMFLCGFFQFTESESKKKSFIYLAYTQLFLLSAFFTHPENTAYILAGVFVLVFILFIQSIFVKNKIMIKKYAYFFVSSLFSLLCFVTWYYAAIMKNIGQEFLISSFNSPIPKLSGLLFHFSGIIPILALVFGIICMLFYKKHRKKSLIFIFLFLFALFISYFPYILHLIMPVKFPVIDSGSYTDFTSSRFFIKTLFVNPNSVIPKMISFWWFSIIAMAGVFYIFWDILKIKILRYLFILGTICILCLDISLMYYNKPIITEKQYNFLIALDKKIPQNAVIIGPPGYNFSAWIGPVLHRDSISNRSAQHTRNSISKNINADIRKAYTTGNFEELLNKLPNQKVIVLFTEKYTDLKNKLIHLLDWQLVFELNNTYALRKKE